MSVDWTLYGRKPGWDHELPLISGPYNDMGHTMRYRKREGYTALALIRDIPLGKPYADGSQDSRMDRGAAQRAFETDGYGMPASQYWSAL